MSLSDGPTRALRERKKNVDQRIEELKALSESLSRVIEDLEGTGVQTQFDSLVEAADKSHKCIGLTNFISSLFHSLPEKKWTIQAIRAEVMAGVKAERVRYAGAHLNENIYSVISRLATKGEIKKGGKHGGRWYKSI